MGFKHTPVMPDEVVYFLKCESGGLYIDGTLGGGGHTARILEAAEPDGRVIGIDHDEDAINEARENLKNYISRVTTVKGNFADIKGILGEMGITGVNGIVLDLGVSSYHLEKPERGFSFRFEGPLDMRMDRSKDRTAREIVNKLREKELADIFRQYGEERWANKIAKAIVKRRKVGQITTTTELADIVCSSIPARYHPRDIHPATRTFQALRIVVNDELRNLERAIDDGVHLIKSGGRFVVISFHSLEDRVVKERFRALERGCICPLDFPECRCGKKPVLRIITKKPVIPSPAEIMSNPRARSAKMRAAERI